MSSLDKEPKELFYDTNIDVLTDDQRRLVWNYAKHQVSVFTLQVTNLSMWIRLAKTEEEKDRAIEKFNALLAELNQFYRRVEDHSVVMKFRDSGVKDAISFIRSLLATSASRLIAYNDWKE